jgi:RNA polymerase sigma-70 factor (ECF subfamily)
VRDFPSSRAPRASFQGCIARDARSNGSEAGQARTRMSESEDSDAGLVSRAKAGSDSAFDELVRRRDRDLVELAARLLDDRVDAEDVRQLAWLRVWQGLARFDERARFTTWAFAIVVNLCRDRRRERARRRGLHETRPTEGLDGGATSDRRDPHEELVQAELAARVRSALDALPEDERECLVLRHWHDLPATEIGAIVGRPRTTVASCLARALTRMQLKLRPFLRTPEERPAGSTMPREQR